MDTRPDIASDKSSLDAALEIKLFHKSEDLLHIAPAWEDLASRCNRGFSFFQKPHWVRAWLEGFGPKEITLVTAWRGESLVLLIALMPGKNILARQLICATYPEAGYGSILVSDEEDQTDLIQRALKFIATESVADLVTFHSLPSQTTWLTAPGGSTGIATPHLRSSAAAYAAMIEVDAYCGFEPHPRTGERRSHKNIRKKRRKLEREGAVSLEKIDHKHPLSPTIMSTMHGWKLDWLDQRGLAGGVVRSEPFITFVDTLMSPPKCVEEPPFCMALMQNGVPVAASLFLPDENILHCYFTAFNPNHADCSPGLILILMIVDWMRGQHWDFYDFEGHPEPYKDKMATRRVTLVDASFPMTWRGNIQNQISRIPLRQTIKSGFYRLPKRIRQTILR